MPVRSIHEGPALTPEVVAAMPEEERALTKAIMLRWAEERIARCGVEGEGLAPMVQQAARNAVRMLVGEKLICGSSAFALSIEPGASVFGTIVFALMMEGAEVLRWHQLAEARPDLGAQLQGGGERREDLGGE